MQSEDARLTSEKSLDSRSNSNSRYWNNYISPRFYNSIRSNIFIHNFAICICRFLLCLYIIVLYFRIRLYFNHHNFIIKFNNKVWFIPMVCISNCISPEESFELIWCWPEPVFYTTISIKKICESSFIRRIKLISFMASFCETRIYLRS